MGREVRMVPPGWQHPIDAADPFYRDGSTRYYSLLEGPYSKAVAEWDEEKAQWDAGFRRSYRDDEKWQPRDEDDTGTYEEYAGQRPKPEDYMPEFEPGTATHYCMYETCSEGSPISPAFATPEELARWLADNNASAFGSQGASYDAWLRMIRGSGHSVSAVISGGVIMSGVEFEGRD